MRDVDAEAAQEKREGRIGRFIQQLSEGGGLGGLEEGELRGLTIRFPTEEDPTALVVIRAAGAAGRRVAFIGAYRLGDALLAWRKRSQVGRMKWREDVPWEQRERGS